MKKLLLALTVSLFPYLAFAAGNDELAKKNRMIKDVEFIQNTLEITYAPAEWKKEYCGWDLGMQASIAKKLIMNTENITTKQYQRILRDFLYTTRDYHMSVGFHSTESAKLPFQVCGSQGRYFFVSIIREDMPKSKYPFNVGDELVTFDGKLTDKAIKEFKKTEERKANPDTDQAFAEVRLTSRTARSGIYVPQGIVTIGVRKKGSDVIENYEVKWDYKPEKMTNHYGLLAYDEEYDRSPRRMPGLVKMRMDPLYTLMDRFPDPSEGRNHDMGSPTGFLPYLGKRVWTSKADFPFHAYIYKTPNNKIVGYVRIATFSPPDPEVDIKEFKQLISKFQKETEGLIIDICNNPGGIDFYMYGILSMLTDKPLKLLLEREMITYDRMADYLDMIEELSKAKTDEEAIELFDEGDTFFELPVNLAFVQNYMKYTQNVVDAWNSGKNITELLSPHGMEYIKPHQTARYNKPILVLTNHRSISCGDFFPAILQDNKRATIMGSRTAGAGGYVKRIEFPNRYGVSFFRTTGSIAYRSDMKPLENLGVTPDIPYAITVEDLQNYYKPFATKINAAIDSILLDKDVSPSSPDSIEIHDDSETNNEIEDEIE